MRGKSVQCGFFAAHRFPRPRWRCFLASFRRSASFGTLERVFRAETISYDLIIPPPRRASFFPIAEARSLVSHSGRSQTGL